MKKYFTSFLLLISSLNMFSQNCLTDSVVTTLARERGDDFINSIQQTTYNTVNGVIVPSNAPFTRRFLSLNSNHDTLEYNTTTGTGSGYVNAQRTSFTYDAVTNLVLSRIQYTGNGSNWNVLKSELWNYNAANQLTDYTQTDTSGNIEKINYTYSGNSRQSIIYQSGSGANWTNDRRFNIVYTSGARDSLILQKWDNINSTWIDSLASKYQLRSNYGVEFTDTIILAAKTLINTYDYDTLDILNSEIHSDSTWGGFYKTEIYYYNNIHSHNVLFHYVLYDMGCTSTSEYHGYDQYGVQTSQTNDGHCGIGSGSGSSVQYDSLYRRVNYETNSHSTVSADFKYWDYFYSSSDSIGINYLPIGTLGGTNPCMGDSVIPELIVAGGCGPYTYSWLPSTGLSSDTAAQPNIYIGNDTTTYTITVSDTSGHLSQTTFSAYPLFPATITFDTTACPGCPVILHANSANVNYRWYKDGVAVLNANSQDFVATNSGSYFVILTSQNCTATSDTVNLTLSGLTRFSGKIYYDRDSNCTYTAIDTAMSIFGFGPFLLTISKANYQITIAPDSSGTYDIPIDTGTFVVKLTNPSPTLIPFCLGTDSLIVYVPAFGDTLTGNDFALKGDAGCKRLELHTSSSGYTPCRSAFISVQYANTGLSTENNAVIDVFIPSELVVTSASLPYTVIGNQYSFPLPPLSLGERRSLTISADVICNPALTNATLCIDAEISPKDICSFHPDSTWDGSNIRVTTYCNNDSSACFIISNKALQANGNMSTSSNWRLYSNNRIAQQGTFQLNANQDTTLCFLSNGDTYRLEADQLPAFPIPGYAYKSLERCGIDTTNYSLFQIMNHYSSQGLPFYDSNCRHITNSYDPNIKTAQPEGLGPNQYIPSGQLMKYRIDFQNTGTDTAFVVKVVDFLSPYTFDLSTIKFLGTSHPCTYEYDNNNSWKWNFYNINLPDSNIDQMGSQGYLEFSIKTLGSLTNRRQVRNLAQIYFDSNPAIQTSIVSRTVCNVVNPEVSISLDSSYCIGRTLKCKAHILHGGTPIIKWYKNSIQLFNMNSDSLTYPGIINLNDTIYCTVKSNESCAFPETVVSNKIIMNHYGIQVPIISFSSPNLVATTSASYQWYYNQVLISGATAQNYFPLNDGLYQVQVSDSNGCIALSNLFNYVAVGISSLSIKNVVIFPNPSNDQVTVESEKSIQLIRIVDQTGRCALSISPKNVNAKFSVKNITNGRYIIAITTEEGMIYKPLIIIHQN